MNSNVSETRLQAWVGIIKEVEASGLCKNEWCRQNDVPLTQYYYWQRKVRNYLLSQQPKTTGMAGGAVFCELAIPTQEGTLIHGSKPSCTDTVTGDFVADAILLHGDFRLLVNSSTPEKTIAAVAAALSHV